MQSRLEKGARLYSDKRKKEDINPMSSLANLADVMLVFSCGLLLALITNWNVDVETIKQTNTDKNSMYEVEEVKEDTGNQTETADLEEVGKVYKDPQTGKWYFKSE